MKEIKLTKNYLALVDDEDYKNVNQFSWSVHFSPRNKKPYARGWVKGKLTYMHRFILNCSKKVRPWRVSIFSKKDNKRIHIGYFSSEKEAGLAYNNYAIEHYGEFVKLNII